MVLAATSRGNNIRRGFCHSVSNAILSERGILKRRRILSERWIHKRRRILSVRWIPNIRRILSVRWIPNRRRILSERGILKRHRILLVRWIPKRRRILSERWIPNRRRILSAFKAYRVRALGPSLLVIPGKCTLLYIVVHCIVSAVSRSLLISEMICLWS